MVRFHQLLLIVSAVALSWLGMQAVHELGHVLAAHATGGTVRKVVLHPLVISRTDVGPNPRPLVVCWAGPVFGAIAPAAAWAAWRAFGLPGAYVLRFFAGFCLCANGLYLAVGSFHSAGDAGDLLDLGSPIWTLWLFGAAATALGLLLWHGQGPHFGLAEARGQVEPAAAYGAGVAAVAAATAEVIWGTRG